MLVGRLFFHIRHSQPIEMTGHHATSPPTIPVDGSASATLKESRNYGKSNQHSIISLRTPHTPLPHHLCGGLLTTRPL